MSEKMSKQVEAQLSELNSKVDEANRTINDLQSQKSRLQQETADLTRQLEEAEHRVGTLTKEKATLTSQLEEAKRSLEDETRVSTLRKGSCVNWTALGNNHNELFVKLKRQPQTSQWSSACCREVRFNTPRLRIYHMRKTTTIITRNARHRTLFVVANHFCFIHQQHLTNFSLVKRVLVPYVEFVVNEQFDRSDSV